MTGRQRKNATTPSDSARNVANVPCWTRDNGTSGRR